MSEMKKIGIITDGYTISKQVYDFIINAESSSVFKITHVIIQNNSHTNTSHTKKLVLLLRTLQLGKALQYILFFILMKAERIILSKHKDTKRFFQNFDIRDFQFEELIVNPRVSKSGHIFRYAGNDLSKIKNLELDALIRCGTGILKGNILNICPFGIISLHHGDNRFYRGGPPAFWEVYERSDTTGYIIQVLNEELDGGQILFRGNIPTKWLYTLNLISIIEYSNKYFVKTVEDYLLGKTIYSDLEVPYYKKLYKKPTSFQTLVYVLKTFLYAWIRIKNYIFGRSYRWSVAYKKTSHWSSLSLRNAKYIPNLPNKFLADPFLYEKDGKVYCFMEEFDYSTRKGHIVVYLLSEDLSVRLGVVISEDFHLSFPYVFEANGEIYMCPETHQIEEIRIYKCLEFPLKWEFDRTLISNISAADTIIFERDQRWFMLTNLSAEHEVNHDSELHLFTSKSLQDDIWTPSPKNPVGHDANLTRNGGIILDHGDVYRVFQKQGFAFYGKEFGVMKITEIDELDYREEKLFDVKPDFSDGILGTHSFSYVSGYAAFDCVRIDSKKT